MKQQEKKNKRGRRPNFSYIEQFQKSLQQEERSPATIQKYVADVRQFFHWLGERPVSKETVTQWKQELQQQRKAATVNGKLAALHAFFRWKGWEGCRVKALKLQRNVFCDPARELRRHEYKRLLSTAEAQGKTRLRLVMETIGATGMRVSELQYITIEALRVGKVEIALKGKIRVILLPKKLRLRLQQYAKTKKIASGELFRTRSGRPLSRKQIWAEMKALCQAAGIASSKVFPHNLRHLFARCFYQVCPDLTKLADLLGHSQIETTRIYLRSAGAEHAKVLEQMHLLL